MRRALIGLTLFLVLAAAAAFTWANRHPEIAAIARPNPATFDKALVKRGEKLAGIGNCHVCHTAPGGRRYAGGLALPTPFGTIHTTNITPDVETGIGAWSEQAFIRAMREGLDRRGRHLYPAFPYDYYTKTTEADLEAIYAYLMTQAPVQQQARDNTLSFPFNMRFLLAGWNLAVPHARQFKPDPSKDAEWNRGAYLVEGLGHCGACHTPRNTFGAAPKTGAGAYAGAHVEGWYVPPLNAGKPGPIPWTQKTLADYLIDGWSGQHGIAAGPMTPVVDDLKDQSEDDVFAIAAYVVSLEGGARPPTEQDKIASEASAFATRMEWGFPENPPLPSDPLLQRGAKVFERECVTCHKSGGKPAPLALTTIVNAPDALNLIRVTFEGIKPPRGVLDRSMPARASQITDEEMVALAAFVRSRFTTKPAWTKVEEAVRAVRRGGH